jgi:hypothetical protein
MRLVDLQEESHDLYQLLCVKKGHIDCACEWRGQYESVKNLNTEDYQNYVVALNTLKEKYALFS